MAADAQLSAVPGPWFRLHPRAAVVIAGMLFAAVFVLQLGVGGSGDGLSGLFVLPIALIAIAFGASAGLGGAERLHGDGSTSRVARQLGTGSPLPGDLRRSRPAVPALR